MGTAHRAPGADRRTGKGTTMTTDQNHPDQHHHPDHDDSDQNTPDETGRRPLGFWLKLVDRRISEEMETLFADDGITRRDWRMLNLLAGEARDERLAERLHARPHALHRLVERGWVAGFPPEITDPGREARDRLEAQVTALRERVAGAVSPDDFATTLRSLEAIARELGWDESQPLPRGRRGGRRFGGRMHEHHEGADRFGHRHGFGRFDDAEEQEHCGPHTGFGHRRHGFGRRGGGRQDVHVHVHLHDGNPDRSGDR
jgi:hypothetical protein